MTNEEAIRYISCIVGDKSTDFVMQPIKTEVLDMAISALEKQIPSKPKYSKKFDSVCVCRSCDHNIPVVVRDGRMPYCPFCGQRLDWSEVE